MKPWPDSRPEVLQRLEQLCNACRAARADFDRLAKEWSSLKRSALGPTHAPVQAMLIRFERLTDDLRRLEEAAIKAVQGEVVSEEEDEGRCEAIYAAMQRCLTGRERQVFAAMYLSGPRRRIARVEESPYWDDSDLPEVDPEDYTEISPWTARPYSDTSWTERFFEMPAGTKTQEQIAKDLGISQSRVSQLAKSALAKMTKEIGWLE
jgi:RNA polymerase sigma factor (sigma-70 family)